MMQKLSVVLVAILTTFICVVTHASAQEPDYLTIEKEEPAQQQKAGVGSIRGLTRLAGETGEPVGGVQVEWVSTNGKRGKVRSNEKGHYAIQNLAPGQYVLNASRDGLGQRNMMMVSVLAGNESVYDISFRPEDAQDEEIVEVFRRGEPNPRQEAVVRELEQLKRKLRDAEPESPGRSEMERRRDELSGRLRAERSDEPRQPNEQFQPDRSQRGRQPQPSPRAPRTRMELRVYALEHVPAEHAAEIVNALVGMDSIVVPDWWSGKLFVRAQTQYLQEIEEILHHLDVPPRHRPEGEMGRRSEQRSEEREWREDGRPSGEDREGPIFSITIGASKENDAEVLFRESPITRDELAERLSHLDEPGSWTLRIHVLGDIPEEMLRDVVEEIEEVARAKGIHRLEIEAIRQEEAAEKR